MDQWILSLRSSDRRRSPSRFGSRPDGVLRWRRPWCWSSASWDSIAHLPAPAPPMGVGATQDCASDRIWRIGRGIKGGAPKIVYPTGIHIQIGSIRRLRIPSPGSRLCFPAGYAKSPCRHPPPILQIAATRWSLKSESVGSCVLRMAPQGADDDDADVVDPQVLRGKGGIRLQAEFD